MPYTPMTDDEIAAEKLETALVRAAGTGAPCPVQTPAALARYHELCEDVAYLTAHGITLILPDEHAPDSIAK